MRVELPDFMEIKKPESKRRVIVAKGEWSHGDFNATYKIYRKNPNLYIAKIEYMGKKMEHVILFTPGVTMEKIRDKNDTLAKSFVEYAACSALKNAYIDYYGLDEETYRKM